MSEVQAAPKLQKWPFYLADLIVSAIAAFVLIQLGTFEGTTDVVIAVACLIAAGWGAWLAITPWLVEFRTHSSLAESSNLKTTLEQIQDLQKVADLIRQSNSQWQGVQDASGRTVTAAQEIANRMRVETEEFIKFIENARDQERTGLRLEVDKLRKMEGDWLKMAVQILDHVYALFRAGERSGQQALVEQLGQFQNACRDAARRMGLVPFAPALREAYDPRRHQLPGGPAPAPESGTIGEVLATGFTYQGQLLRRALVLLERPPEMRLEESAPEAIPSDAQPGQPSPGTEEASSPVADPGPAIVPDERAEPMHSSTEESKRASSSNPGSAQNELPLA